MHVLLHPVNQPTVSIYQITQAPIYISYYRRQYARPATQLTLSTHCTSQNSLHY